MVQGERCSYKTHFGVERDRDSKRAGFESMQKRGASGVNASKTTITASSTQYGSGNNTNKTSTSYGSYGPIFKNEEHFKSLHFA